MSQVCSDPQQYSQELQYPRLEDSQQQMLNKQQLQQEQEQWFEQQQQVQQQQQINQNQEYNQQPIISSLQPQDQNLLVKQQEEELVFYEQQRQLQLEQQRQRQQSNTSQGLNEKCELSTDSQVIAQVHIENQLTVGNESQNYQQQQQQKQQEDDKQPQLMQLYSNNKKDKNKVEWFNPKNLPEEPNNTEKGQVLNCQYCKMVVKSEVQFENNNKTRVLGTVLFFTTVILAPLPFLMKSTRNCCHYCPRCKALLGKIKF